jgi:hypothetical protein
VYGASDGPMLTGVVEPLEELLELRLELLLLLPPLRLDWEPVGVLPELPDAQAPAVKQSEKIPVKAMESSILSIVKLSRLPHAALTLQ